MAKEIEEFGNQNSQPVNNNWQVNNIIWLQIIFIFLIFFFILLGAYLFYRQVDPIFIQKNNIIPTAPNPTELPETSSVPFSPQFAYINSGIIYVTDLTAKKSTKVLDLKQEEEQRTINSLYMKLSPDQRLLAYIGLHDVDKTITVIDISRKKIIYEKVLGITNIDNFAWSPDSSQIAYPLNYQVNEKEYKSAIYVIDLFANTPDYKKDYQLFTPEDIEIAKVEWLSQDIIYYLQISHQPEEKIALASFNISDKSRKIKVIGENSYVDMSLYSADFIISSDRNKILVYTPMPSGAASGTPLNPFKGQIAEFLSVPDLNNLPFSVGFIPEKSQWQDNYLVGIERTLGLPESTVSLINLSNNKKTVLIDMNPYGLLHSVILSKENNRQIMVIWSEYDNKQTISAYDIDNCLELKKQYKVCNPIWILDNSAHLSS